MRSPWLLPVILILVLAILATHLTPRTQPYIYLRAAATSAIPLFLVGFAFVKLLLVREALGFLERTVISICVGLALTPLITLILNYTPYGIKEDPLLITLSAITLLLALCAALRERSGRSTGSTPHTVFRGGARDLGSVLSAAFPLVLAFSLRISPFLMSGLPFSVDAWPSIGYAAFLLKNSPTELDASLSSEELGDRLFGAAISALTGLEPVIAMAFFLPLVGAISILVFYTLVRGIYGERVSLIASILLSTAFTDAILTAGVKGETYARPLHMALLLIFLHRLIPFPKKILLFILIGASLVITHYYLALVTIAILISMGTAISILRWRSGSGLEIRGLLFPLILALQTLAYAMLYAKQILSFTSTIDWLSASSYQLLFFSLALYLALRRPPSRAEIAAHIAAIASAALLLTITATKVSLVLGAPVFPQHYLVYAAPLIVSALLGVLGYEALSRTRNDLQMLVLFWLAAVLGLEAYSIFGSTELGLIAHRGLNHIIPPLSIICALGLLRAFRARGSGLRRVGVVLAIAAFIFILAVNLYAFYATLLAFERYTGYFWLYRSSEYYAGLWISSSYDGVVAGDMKFYYFLRYYFGVDVNVMQGLLYLSGRDRAPEMLVIYDQMFSKGYVVSPGYGVDMPEGWVSRLGDLSLVYSNGVVEIYGRPG